MTNLKHTPAPWKTVNRETLEDGSVYPCSVVGGDDERLVCFLEATVTAELAIAHPNTFWDANKAESPNARLIAAAPEMLNALRRAVLALAFAAETSPAMRDDYKAVSDAIAKATGEQS